MQYSLERVDQGTKNPEKMGLGGDHVFIMLPYPVGRSCLTRDSDRDALGPVSPSASFGPLLAEERQFANDHTIVASSHHGRRRVR
jgi:hypothetical protein